MSPPEVRGNTGGPPPGLPEADHHPGDDMDAYDMLGPLTRAALSGARFRLSAIVVYQGICRCGMDARRDDALIAQMITDGDASLPGWAGD